MHIVAVTARRMIVAEFDLIFVITGLNWILSSVTQGPLTLCFCFFVSLKLNQEFIFFFRIFNAAFSVHQI